METVVDERFAVHRQTNSATLYRQDEDGTGHDDRLLQIGWDRLPERGGWVGAEYDVRIDISETPIEAVTNSADHETVLQLPVRHKQFEDGSPWAQSEDDTVETPRTELLLSESDEVTWQPEQTWYSSPTLLDSTPAWFSPGTDAYARLRLSYAEDRVLARLESDIASVSPPFAVETPMVAEAVSDEQVVFTSSDGSQTPVVERLAVDPERVLPGDRFEGANFTLTVLAGPERYLSDDSFRTPYVDDPYTIEAVSGTGSERVELSAWDGAPDLELASGTLPAAFDDEWTVTLVLRNDSD